MPKLNVKNRTLFHGDNLPFLQGINSGTIDLIATDPPFNKNRDFHAAPDSLAAGARFGDRWRWQEDVHDEWLDALQKDNPEVLMVIQTAKTVWGDGMGAFLCWLGVRLLEMHRVLKDTGSIYLHIDHLFACSDQHAFRYAGYAGPPPGQNTQPQCSRSLLRNDYRDGRIRWLAL